MAHPPIKQRPPVQAKSTLERDLKCPRVWMNGHSCGCVFANHRVYGCRRRWVRKSRLWCCRSSRVVETRPPGVPLPSRTVTAVHVGMCVAHRHSVVSDRDVA